MFKLIIYLMILFLFTGILAGEEKSEQKTGTKKKEESTSKVEEEKRPIATILFSTDLRKKKGKDDKHMFFSGNFKFAWFSGNSNPYRSMDENYFDIGFNLSTKWDNNITKVIATYKQSFFSWPVKDEDTGQYFMEIQEAGTFLLSLDHYIANRFELFTFADTERDDRLLLNIRFSAGAGIKFVFFRNKYWVLDFGVAPVFELTSFIGNETLKEFRLSGRIKTEFVIYEFVRLGTKFFYIPNMFDFPDDYRYDLESYLAFYYFLDEKKTRSIVIRFSYKRKFNSTPRFNQVEKLDQYIMTSIGINF